MLKFGMCCGGGLCCAVLSGVLWFGGGAVVGQAVELTADEEQVVNYLVGLIAEGEAPLATENELREKLGLSAESIQELDRSRLRAAVLAELGRQNVDVGCLDSNCSRYKACSVDRNLALAKGEELERYKQEVALDGQRPENWVAPDFELPDTEGRTVTLSEYRGENVALVFLSTHCNHSMDTLPILAELREKYSARGLEVLPVFINSGDPDTVASRAWELNIDTPLVVSEDKDISKAYDARMVPSTFLIDEQGRVTRRFVGFKDETVLDAAFAELVGS